MGDGSPVLGADDGDGLALGGGSWRGGGVRDRDGAGVARGLGWYVDRGTGDPFSGAGVGAGGRTSRYVASVTTKNALSTHVDVRPGRRIT